MDEKEKDLQPEENTEINSEENTEINSEENSEINEDNNSVEDDGVKYETNDNWKFDAVAPTLSDDFFESKDYTVDTESLVIEDNDTSTEASEATEEVKPKVISKKLKYAIIGVLAVILVGVLAFFGIRYFTVPNGKEGKQMNYASVVATIDGTKISVGMFNYYYANIVNYYEQYADSTGLDTSMDYADQYTTDDEGNQVTWRDFLENEAMEELEKTVRYYNAGLEAGITINDKQQEIIDEYMESAKTSASAESLSLNDYLETYYGKYCTEDTLKLFYEEYFISASYQGYFVAQNTVDESRIDEYFEEHKSDFYQIDFDYIAVAYDLTDDDTKAESQAVVDSYIDKITDEKSIFALIPEIYSEYIEQDVASIMESDEEITEEDARKDAIETYEQSIYATIEGNSSPFSQEFTDWLFDDETAIGEKNYYIDESIGYAYVVLKTDKPSLIDYDTYSVRHILIQPVADDDEKQQNCDFTDEQWAEAEKKANEILDEYNNGDKTELSFALLAESKSEDTASTVAGISGYYGGLYDGVMEGDMVTEFEEWSLDNSRAYGDTGIVKTMYGYHIMYFVNHVPYYEVNAISALNDEDLKASVENQETKIRESALDKAIDKFYSSRTVTEE